MSAYKHVSVLQLFHLSIIYQHANILFSSPRSNSRNHLHVYHCHFIFKTHEYLNFSELSLTNRKQHLPICMRFFLYFHFVVVCIITVLFVLSSDGRLRVKYDKRTVPYSNRCTATEYKRMYKSSFQRNYFTSFEWHAYALRKCFAHSSCT